MEDETKEVTKKVISKPSMRIKMYSRGKGGAFWGVGRGREHPGPRLRTPLDLVRLPRI